jgi:hypothetical protein
MTREGGMGLVYAALLGEHIPSVVVRCGLIPAAFFSTPCGTAKAVPQSKTISQGKTETADFEQSAVHFQMSFV